MVLFQIREGRGSSCENTDNHSNAHCHQTHHKPPQPPQLHQADPGHRRRTQYSHDRHVDRSQKAAILEILDGYSRGVKWSGAAIIDVFDAAFDSTVGSGRQADCAHARPCGEVGG